MCFELALDIKKQKNELQQTLCPNVNKQ